MQIDFDRKEAERAFTVGELETAEQASLRVLKRNRRDITALQILGRCSSQSHRYKEAREYFRKWGKITPNDPFLHFSLAEMSLLQGRSKEALARLDRAIKLRPGFNLALIEKAAVLERIQKYNEAWEVIQDLNVEPEIASNLARIRCAIALHKGDYETAIRMADAFVDGSQQRPAVHAAVLYLKGQAYDKLGDPDRAMEAWHRANEIVRAPFNTEAYLVGVDAAIRFFTRENLKKLETASNESELPVFIAGMPRSGTTLLEQIVDAHPAGYGAGELEDVAAMHREIDQRLDSLHSYPMCLLELTTPLADEMAAPYLQLLRDVGGRGASRVVNKSLLNIISTGLIQLLFPGSRVIYSHRDPIDNCLSIYMNLFKSGVNPYQGDLKAIGSVYRHSERLMAHWMDVLDIPIEEIRYEDMVNDPEPTSRRLISACGLEWDDRCLRFYESGRTVMTLSYHQVSKPIYKSSMKRAERYEKHLGPLLEGLGM